MLHLKIHDMIEFAITVTPEGEKETTNKHKNKTNK